MRCPGCEVETGGPGPYCPVCGTFIGNPPKSVDQAAAPDSATWPTGDRQVICEAYRADPVAASGALAVNYSIKGSRR